MIRKRFLFNIATIGMIGLTACANQTMQSAPSQTVAPSLGGKQIKLDSFNTTSQPSQTNQPSHATRQNECPHDTGTNLGQQGVPACHCAGFLVQCQNNQCVSVRKNEQPEELGCQLAAGQTRNGQYFPGACDSTANSNGNGWYCIGKPVIYLYPTKKTRVDVTVESMGKIVISDPTYPQEGWQNVEAYPDGTLYYKGHKYRELFYETETPYVVAPSNGVTIIKSHLRPSLVLLIDQLGLMPSEREEFLDFWLPKLERLNSTYIFFSVLDPIEKHRLDSVRLSPKPDTRIEFIAYFRPMSSPWTGPALVLPIIPKREGFTMVEWGGTLDLSTKNQVTDTNDLIPNLLFH